MALIAGFIIPLLANAYCQPYADLIVSRLQSGEIYGIGIAIFLNKSVRLLNDRPQQLQEEMADLIS